jgi:hypothetical protein
MDWMDRTLAFYHGQGWDATVDNDGAGAATVPGAAVRLLMALASSPAVAGQPYVKQRLLQAAQDVYRASGAAAGSAPSSAPSSSATAAAPATPLAPSAAAAAGTDDAGFASPAFRLSADGGAAPASPPGAAGVSPTQALSEEAASALAAAYGQLPSPAAVGARAGGYAF